MLSRRRWYVQVAEQLALLTLNHKVLGSNPTRGRVQLITVLCFIAQPFIIIPSSSQYNLRKVKSDIKHQIVIIEGAYVGIWWSYMVEATGVPRENHWYLGQASTALPHSCTRDRTQATAATNKQETYLIHCPGLLICLNKKHCSNILHADQSCFTNNSCFV